MTTATELTGRETLTCSKCCRMYPEVSFSGFALLKIASLCNPRREYPIVCDPCFADFGSGKWSGVAIAKEEDSPCQLTARELNRLVAERVMGLTVAACKFVWPDYCGADDHPYRNAMGIPCDCPMAGSGHGRMVPDYSDDMGAAMQVVEKMVENDWAVRMTRISRPSLWEVLIQSSSRSFREESKSLPEAICRAALLAVDGKGEK